ncbi:MAG: hypothetical protein DI586_10000 [Micavibrio aeruginosavorus]|uniref:Biotin-protein ligase N-terminal domain-containing protein n=1 Tax=Micavibrio aeruginosavorus TaxID=349221 RepID=A0A2W5FEF8_9BACT|nr:MAG: hypothetical protein DI586_10000 [Micavibrio aeruginosavorus]
MKVLFLTGYDLAVHSLDWMLKDEYGPRNVSSINADDLGDTDLSDFNMLVFPGCVGEVSPYPKFMTPKAIQNVRNNIEHGLVLWTDCGGTYEVNADINFTNSDGILKERKGLGFIDGLARGPVEGPAIAPSKQDRFLDVIIKRVFHRAANNNTNTVDICYGNGPGIHLTEAEKNNPDVRIIAYYGDDETSPVAALSKKIGKGLILSFGVLVQIAPAHLQGDFPTSSKAYRHRRVLREHLTHADEQRKILLTDVFNIANTHMEQVKPQRNITQYSLDLRHANIA